MTASEHHALEESLGKGKSRSRYWERKVKEGSEKATGAEKNKEEAKVARLAAFVVVDTKAKAKGDLARVKDALAAAEEARVVAEEARRKA